mgnify:FL=1
MKTSLLCEATLYTADLIVTVAWEAFMALRWHSGPAGKRATRVAKRAALHAVRCGTMLAAVSLGEWWRDLRSSMVMSKNSSAV